MSVLMAAGVPAALVVRALTAMVAALFAARPRACRWIASLGSILASLLTAGVALRVILSLQPVEGVLFRHDASAVVFSYSVTLLSAWFLLVLGVVAVPVAIYSVAYLAHGITESRTALTGAALNVLLAALEVVFVADGAIEFLCAWEVMTLATAALVAIEHQERATRQAAYLYLVMSHVGTGCLLAAFLVLGSHAGSLQFPDMFAVTDLSPSLRSGLFVLFLIGFGVKAGLIPLHVWLPEAHPAAPTNVSTLMSAVLITAGIYGLYRFCGFGLGTPDRNWALALMILGMLSAVLGVLYALAQTDLKRLLAYSTIENSGIIVLGLGAAMMAASQNNRALASIAVAASLAHVLNHAVFKGLLFLGAGSVVMANGTRQIERYGGLLRRMPWTGVFFVIGAMAISGLPLFNGFPSEWLTFRALLTGFMSTRGMVRLSFPLAAAALALTSALAAVCFVRAFGITFLALPRSPEAAAAHESPVLMLLPQAWLAVLCVGLGLFPSVAFHALDGVLASLPGLQPAVPIAHGMFALSTGDAFDHVAPGAFGLVVLAALIVAVIVSWRPGAVVRHVATWACGGALTPQTEYTATAFSKPLLMIFRSVYRPRRQVDTLAEVSPYFPQEVRYRTEIEPTFERYVYGPLVKTIMQAAAGMKILQAGSLHTYLAYVLVLAVLLLIWLGGTT